MAEFGVAAPVERASPADRAFLAMDRGPVPEQVAAVLFFGAAAAPDLGTLRAVLAGRVPRVRRLRQRLVPSPFGCGGPVWVDDDRFELARHVTGRTCADTGEQAVLDEALSVVTRRLPRDRPLWSATLLSDPDGRSLALVVVLHHALADGAGGLLVLGALADDQSEDSRRPADPGGPFPRARPSTAVLAGTALRSRIRGLAHLAASTRLLRRAMQAAGGVHPPRLPNRTLLRPTGASRQVRCLRLPRAQLSLAARAAGGSTNDAVLVAVARALRSVLPASDGQPDPVVVAVPVSGRSRAADSPPGAGRQLGNLVSPMLVAVPSTGPVAAAVSDVAAQVRRHRAAAAGPPPIAILGWLFRPLAAMGGFRWYLRHQRRMHTLVSHVRAPVQPVRLAGHPVVAAAALAVGEAGNMPVYFEVLDYAGTLTVTVVTDPDHFPEADRLVRELESELRGIASPIRSEPPPGRGDGRVRAGS
ncbi:wax ester/triacylglycerol synthase domain-containing protein [Intrasporangium sp.]|uniref:wax ester/triacylglycerol synthase domain-containing protein n=1 Tax=Intrasporangium sp. TaxID=1925024 RepID=UPI0032214A7C